MTSTDKSPLLPVSTIKTPRSVSFNPQTTISRIGDRSGEGVSVKTATTTGFDRPLSSSTHSHRSAPLNSSLSGTQLSSGPPKLSALNSKLRRRNSHGSPLTSQPVLPRPESKIGPQRTTKTAQKLKLLPNPDHGDEGPDEESGRDVYSQFTRIKDPTARRDAARLGKADRERLPRVTAYCTANGYRLESMMRWLKSRKARQKGANPKQFDECIYSPFNYNMPRRNSSDALVMLSEASLNPQHNLQRERRYSDSAIEIEETTSQRREDLIDISHSHTDEQAASHGLDSRDTGQSRRRPSNHLAETQANLPRHRSILGSNSDEFDGVLDGDMGGQSPLDADLDTSVHTPEVFLFQYGTVVIWGMSRAEESLFLSEIARFETEKLASADIQTENFNFYYTREYQARIYNDFISLREKKHYMTKLAISHALSQSVKTSLFEDLLSTTITATQPLPEQIALTGSIAMSRKEIHQQIGQLFILRINIHLQGSVLDSPELMWAEPALEPVYAAVRSYLEMDQRVGLLTERLSVIGDLLAVLKDQVGTKHGEYLEWIVIVLIAAEIVVAAINIVVDLYAGGD